jgi:hypothetical protein
MKRLVIKESQISVLVENLFSKTLISEMKKDPSLQLWNVFRLETEDGINGYTITSSTYPDNVLGPIISGVKNRWRKTGDLQAGDSPDGYLYQYILSKIILEVRKNPEILKSKTLFSRAIRQYFPKVEKMNEEPLNKITAESLKRQLYKTDKESFKYKGAALFGGSTGRPKSDDTKLTKTVGEAARDVLRELFGYDEVSKVGNVWTFNDYAFNEMMRSDLPTKIKDEITQIKEDPSNASIGKDSKYMIPSESVVSKMLDNFKNLIDKEEYPDEEEED